MNDFFAYSRLRASRQRRLNRGTFAGAVFIGAVSVEKML